MKQIQIDILKHLAENPGVSLNRIGTELSSRWASSYARAVSTELLKNGFLINEQTIKNGFKLSLSEQGKQALESARV